MKDSRINRVIRTGESVERSEFKITHVTDPEEGPVDGCSVETRVYIQSSKEKGCMDVRKLYSGSRRQRCR